MSLKFLIIQMGPEENGREGETEKDYVALLASERSAAQEKEWVCLLGAESGRS